MSKNHFTFLLIQKQRNTAKSAMSCQWHHRWRAAVIISTLD